VACEARCGGIGEGDGSVARARRLPLERGDVQTEQALARGDARVAVPGVAERVPTVHLHHESARPRVG